mgnify:CR=1 FL=1
MQKTDFIILWHSTVHKKNITILTPENKKRTADTYELSTFFNNILVLPTSRSLNIGFQYKSHSQAVTVQ